MSSKWREVYQNALTAGQEPITPEQELVLLADLRNTVELADRNTRHNQKGEFKRYITDWMDRRRGVAVSKIKQREKGE
ncbi:hypothetical protein DPO11_19290 [Salmonella enterica]|nr:hypothetical protein [Salmonella enterica]